MAPSLPDYQIFGSIFIAEQGSGQRETPIGIVRYRYLTSTRTNSKTIRQLGSLNESPFAKGYGGTGKVFELDPLLCPKCGSQMRIKAFITNPHEIDWITKNLGIPNQRAPPPLKFVLPIAA